MITIDYNVCNRCSGAKEKRCERICPGNLITQDGDGWPVVRPREDCWACTSCIKDCPVAAMSLRLPFQIEQGAGASLNASATGNKTHWTITDRRGKKEEFTLEVVKKCIS
ncbi:MAG: ferredoxin family protein [Candidatus Brocadiales bacterium]|jgi:adenylylsulfate reductase subunit B